MNTPIKIEFCIDFPIFLSTPHIWVDWSFPHIPRVGEFINPLIWLESPNCNLAKLIDCLHPEDKENVGNSDFKSWLFDYAIGYNYVASVMYSRNRPTDDIHIFIVLDEKPLHPNQNS